VVLTVLTLIASGCSSRGNKPITIGAVFPLTGPAAQYGKYWREGLELAIDDAVATGMVKKGEVRLVAEDGETNPIKSVIAFQKLLAADKVVAVIPGTSGVILAIKPLANKAHVVIMNASAISPDIEDADDYSFSVLPDANIEGAFLAEFAYKTGKRRAGVLYRNDPSGKAFLDAFRKRLTELGGKIVFEDSQMPNEQDFKPYLTKIKSQAKMDILFVASFGPEVATYLKQASELGVKIPVLAYTTFNSPKVLEIAGAAANGVCYSAPAFDATSDDPAAKDIRAKLLTKYGQTESNYYIAAHYDAMMLLLSGISKGYRDSESLKTYLASLKTYQGKSGTITFLKNGAATIPLRMYTVKEGKFAPFVMNK